MAHAAARGVPFVSTQLIMLQEDKMCPISMGRGAMVKLVCILVVAMRTLIMSPVELVIVMLALITTVYGCLIEGILLRHPPDMCGQQRLKSLSHGV